MNDDEFLTLRDVSVTFADTGEEVLTGISLTVPAGAFVAMVVFLVLLVEGLVWAWQKGVLVWK